MIRNFIIVACFLLSFSAIAADITEFPYVPSKNVLDLDCDIQLEFGSYASGIDRHTFDKITNFIRESDVIASAAVIPWGKEGERTICIGMLSPETTEAIYTTMRALIPADQSKSPVSLHKKMTNNEHEAYE